MRIGRIALSTIGNNRLGSKNKSGHDARSPGVCQCKICINEAVKYDIRSLRDFRHDELLCFAKAK